VAVDGWTRYLLREKIFALGEDFWIENERGEQVYKVDGAAFSLRHSFVLQDAAGNELLSGESKLLSFQPTVNLEKGGQPYATISKKLFTFLHQTYDIALADGTAYEANGDITNHEYAVTGPGGQGGQVAQMSRAWFSIRDSYGVAVAPGIDVPLMLAAAVCIEEISERERERNR
jgi:uncharacterized protein YxjI